MQTIVATFNSPFAMAFLSSDTLIVSEKTTVGALRLVTAGVKSDPLIGLPDNAGILDILPSPQFFANGTIYFSFIETGTDGSRQGRNVADASTPSQGLALATARLVYDRNNIATLSDVRVIWRQAPKIVAYPGSGEFGGRIAFSPDGKYLFLTAGDRQEFEPVQKLDNTLGKIIRLFPDGSVPTDNPFIGRPSALPEIWTLGHRNPYGLAFDAAGRLWSHEMGPKGGDELNIIAPGQNYGWPVVSYGNNYDGSPIVKPSAGDGFAAAAAWWDPVIAPAGMIIYSGDRFAAWRGNAIISGLQYNGLVRVSLNAPNATEVERISLGARIREVEQGPDGGIWVLEDGTNARLIRLDPVF
jgi:glucose/arabinose dehydrogenase